MIDDGLSVVFRGICIVGRALLEFGVDIGLRMPGKLLQKVFWPPNLVRPVEEGPVTYLLGVVFYLVAGYLVLFVCCP